MKITTPNWFNNVFGKSLDFGQENQFGSTRGLRYGPLRINKMGIFVNNGTLDSTVITESGFHGYGLTGTEQITLDANTGVNITDGTNSVFQAVISGANIGDVVMGDYSGGAGAMYDKSATSFSIKGTLTAGSISIGSYFKVDSNGNIWSGHSDYASAPFKVSNSGALVATNATITGSVTATSGSFTGAVYASSGSFSGSITSTSGTIGGWTIGSSSLSSSNVTLSTSNGGAISVLTSGSGFLLESNASPPYIAFLLSSSLKATLLPTSAGTGGIRLLDGDLVLNNNRSILINDTTGGSSLYGGISITSGNQLWLTMGTANTFYLYNNAQNDAYFTVSATRAYHKAEFQANKITSNSGNLVLDPEGSNKVKLESNLDMNEKNIDGCDTVWAYNFSSRSDKKIKKDIVEFKSGLDLIDKINPVTFQWKNREKGKSHYGLIAQDLEKVLPSLVAEDDKNIKNINYLELIPIIISSIKELKLKVYN